MIRRDPFVGFGDDTNSSVKFQVVHSRGGVATWDGGDRKLNMFDIGGGQAVVQRGANQPWTIKLRLLFESLDALELLQTLQGESATLRILWGITTRAGGTKWTDITGTSYLVLPDTILLDLTDQKYHLSGPCEATAMFWRPYVASPYVGFTLLSPEDS